MKVRAQIGMVLNLDKCIGCHTFSVTCKNVWSEFSPVYREYKGEFVIGRKTETVAPIAESLLDLAPRGGYAQGISRRHAVDQRTDHGYEILDLGSANGTWLNDERLAPHKNYPLPSGSHLRLGSMRLFVFYHPLKETK